MLKSLTSVVKCSIFLCSGKGPRGPEVHTANETRVAILEIPIKGFGGLYGHMDLNQPSP